MRPNVQIQRRPEAVRCTAGLGRCIAKRTEHNVDTRLIAGTLGFEPLQNIGIDP